jgi:hypothetical protein
VLWVPALNEIHDHPEIPFITIHPTIKRPISQSVPQNALTERPKLSATSRYWHSLKQLYWTNVSAESLTECKWTMSHRATHSNLHKLLESIDEKLLEADAPHNAQLSSHAYQKKS